MYARAVVGDAQRVQPVVPPVRGDADLELVDLLERVLTRPGDVGHDQLLVGAVGVRVVDECALGVLRVLPEEELVRDLRPRAAREEGGDQLRVGCVLAGDVVEADRGAHRRLASGAAVDLRAAAVVEHHQQLLLRPDAQLARCLAGVALVGRPDLPDHPRIGGVGHVHGEDAGVQVGAVGTAAHVGVVAAHGERGIHAAVEQRLVAHELERAGRALGHRTQHAAAGGGDAGCDDRRGSAEGLTAEHRLGDAVIGLRHAGHGQCDRRASQRGGGFEHASQRGGGFEHASHASCLRRAFPVGCARKHLGARKRARRTVRSNHSCRRHLGAGQAPARGG